MKHDIKNLYDDVVPYICALAIMGLLLAMGLTIVSNVTFRNANVIYRVSEKGNFYGEVAQAADAAMSKVEEPDSLLKGVSANLATEEQVKSDFKEYVDNANHYLHSSDYNLNSGVKSDAIEKELRDRVEKRMAGMGETMEKSDTAAIDKYIEAVGAAYSAEVSLLNPFKTSILRIRSVIANTMRNIALGCIFIAALCIVIYRQTRSRRYSLRWTGCGTTAAGVCLLTVPALFNTSIASGDYTLSKNAKLLEAGISRSFCATAVVCGIVIVLIGGAILFTGIFINKRSRSRRI